MDRSEWSRRRYLAVCGSIAGLAGCSSIESFVGGGPDTHPFADRTVVVQISNVESDGDRLEELLQGAVSFWNSHGDQYLSYTTSFEYRPDAEDPDLLLEEVSSLGSCGRHDGDIGGCAPLLEAGDHGSLPATATVEVQENDWQYQKIIEHEIGHTLGLRHDDEPTRVMDESWENRFPEFEEREQILDLAEERSKRYSEAADAITRGNEAANAENFETAADRFQDAVESFEKARQTLQTTADLVDELSEFEPADLDRLASLRSTEQSYVEAILETLPALVEASRQLAAGTGGADQYNEAIRRYNEVQEMARPDLREYISAVGLRG